jgi:hypothetical protein
MMVSTLRRPSRSTHVLLAVGGTIVIPLAIVAAGCASDPPEPFDTPVKVDWLDRISDLSDGTDAILALGFRIGTWYTFNDATVGAQQWPPATLFTTTPDGPGGMGNCARTYGEGFAAWGAGIGLDLNDPGLAPPGMTDRAPYDCSAFKGIAFAAKGTGNLRFEVGTAAVETNTAGGTCLVGTTNPSCGDNHGVNIPLTSQWRTYAVPFAALTQEGFGLRVPFDSKKVVALYWSVSEGQPFDYSITDVGFFR